MELKMGKYPVKQLKVYQSVTFEQAQNSFFTPSQYLSIRTSKPAIEIYEQENGSVVVKSDKCMIRIGAANVAFIEYDLSPPKKEEEGLLAPAKKDKKG
jgi:hypothetical protein